MTIDRQAQQFIDQWFATGAKQYQQLTPQQARMLEYPQTYQPEMQDPEVAVEHLYIPGPTADLPIRIYRPKALGTDKSQRAMLFFHGSGWMMSNVGTNHRFAINLAKSTASVVIAVNYQKAPEHKFPIPMDDCFYATQWAFSNAAALGLDADNIGIFGDSAGGNLAAAVVLRGRDQQAFTPAFQVLVYPALRHGREDGSAAEFGQGCLLETAGLDYYWGHYVRQLDDFDNPYCQPFKAADFSGLPATFIYCAQCDPLCDDGVEYAQLLQSSGIKCTSKVYPGMIHGFIKMFDQFPQAQQFLDDLRRDLDTHQQSN